MGLILGALRDPATKQVLLCGAELLVALRRRHEVVAIGRENAPHQFTAAGMAWLHRHLSRLRGLQGLFAPIEAQLRLARFLVGPMALKAIVREKRTDVPVELQGARLCPRARHEQKHPRREDKFAGDQTGADFSGHVD